MGVNLWGESPLYVNPVMVKIIYASLKTYVFCFDDIKHFLWPDPSPRCWQCPPQIALEALPLINSRPIRAS